VVFSQNKKNMFFGCLCGEAAQTPKKRTSFTWRENHLVFKQAGSLGMVGVGRRMKVYPPDLGLTMQVFKEPLN
jgi:hypothetical protein